LDKPKTKGGKRSHLLALRREYATSSLGAQERSHAGKGAARNDQEGKIDRELPSQRDRHRQKHGGTTTQARIAGREKGEIQERLTRGANHGNQYETSRGWCSPILVISLAAGDKRQLLGEGGGGFTGENSFRRADKRARAKGRSPQNGITASRGVSLSFKGETGEKKKKRGWGVKRRGTAKERERIKPQTEPKREELRLP